MQVIFGLGHIAHLTIPSRCDYVELFHTLTKQAKGVCKMLHSKSLFLALLGLKEEGGPYDAEYR